MSNLLLRAFNARLHTVTSVPNRSLSRLMHPSQHILVGVNSNNEYFTRKIYKPPAQQQQCRKYSIESLSELNMSLFRYVTSSDVSLQLKNMIINLHDSTGLPWWATVMVTAASIRLIIGLPLGIFQVLIRFLPQDFQQHIMAQITLTKFEHAKIMKEKEPEIALQAKRGKWPDSKKQLALLRESRKTWKSLVVKNNCHPFKAIILTWAQLPLWLLASCTFRDMVDSTSTSTPLLTKQQLQTEGVLWNTNLCAPDDTSILPTSLFLTSWMLIEISTLTPGSVSSLFSKLVTFLLRIFSLMVFFVGMVTPSCLPLYWTTSAFLALAQNLLLMAPTVRRLLMIPITPREVPNPYRAMAGKFHQKYFSWLKTIDKPKV